MKVAHARPCPPLDLPGARRSGTRRSSRICPLRGAGRTAGAAVAAAGVAARSRRDMGCSDRVRRLDLSAYATREFIPDARRRGRLHRRIHPALHTAGSLSGRSHALDAGRAGQFGADSESRRVRRRDIQDEKSRPALEDVPPQVFVFGDGLEPALHQRPIDAHRFYAAVG